MDAHDQNGDAMTDGPEFDRCFRDTLETLLAWRRDVRRFRTEPLPDGLLADLLRLAALSPSVGNAPDEAPLREEAAPEPGITLGGLLGPQGVRSHPGDAGGHATEQRIPHRRGTVHPHI